MRKNIKLADSFREEVTERVAEQPLKQNLLDRILEDEASPGKTTKQVISTTSGDSRNVAGRKIYYIEGVAKMLGVSTRTVLKYFYKGSLKGKKIGGKWTVTEEQIVDFLDR